MELSNDFDKAKTRALKILSFRDHSGGELTQKLGKHFDEKTCKKALAWIREIGYQDDEKYAEKLASVLIETKHYGVRKARWEMKQKGLSEEVINAALEAYDGDEIVGIIARIIERKYTDFLDDRAGIKKTTDALMRRGYDYSDIKTAMTQVRESVELEYE
ncbi:MAG: recombination regulator RecX [Oscillospiraceae bacterium]|nr:recombination regulator RecX [Oscillospiraceae bacterium]